MERPVEGISCRSHLKFEMHFKSLKCKVLDQPDVKDAFHKLYASYILVSADKAANNVIVLCKKYCTDTLVKELGINNVNSNKPTFIAIDESFKTIVKSHNHRLSGIGNIQRRSKSDISVLYSQVA